MRVNPAAAAGCQGRTCGGTSELRRWAGVEMKGNGSCWIEAAVNPRDEHGDSPSGETDEHCACKRAQVV